METTNKTYQAADRLYAEAVGAPRDNGSVRSSNLTPHERRLFAKIARENGSTADPVVDALADAGLNPNQARSFAAEMRKRENGGVTALALALPNPAGPRSIPPDLSAIRSRSKDMAKFIGRRGKRDNKKRDNKSGGFTLPDISADELARDNRSRYGRKRNNRSLKKYDIDRTAAVSAQLPQLFSRRDEVASELAQDPLTLADNLQKAVATFYLDSMGKPRTEKFKTYTDSKGNTKRNTRNLAAYDIEKGRTTATDPEFGTAVGKPLMIGLVPYTSILSTSRRGGGGGSSKVIDIGPNTLQNLLITRGSPKYLTGRKGTKALRASLDQANELIAAGYVEAGAFAREKALAEQMVNVRVVKTKAKRNRQGVITKKAVLESKKVPAGDLENLIDPNGRDRRARAFRGFTSGINDGKIRLSDARAIYKLAGETDPKFAALADLPDAELAAELRKNSSSRRGPHGRFLKKSARNNRHPIMRKRHNQGGLDAKTIGFGVAGFAAGTIVGTVANDYAKKIPMVGGYAPYLVAAGLAADAYFAHSNRGYIFKMIPNIGLRYGLAAGLIFPMVARGLASKVLNFAKLGMVDTFAGGAKSGTSGFGDIYDTAFEDVEGTGQYLAESGLGQYLAESGLGVDVTAAPAGFGEYGVPVRAASAGVGQYLAESGLGVDVMAAPAGFGAEGVPVRAASAGLGEDDDTAGELDAAYLDGVGEDFVDSMRAHEGFGADDDDSPSADSELSDEDLALEGFGATPGESVVRMTPSSAQRATRIAQVRVLGRSKRVPGTLLVAVLKTGRKVLPKVGGIPSRSSTVGIPPAPPGQANFRPGGIFAETIFGGRGFMG